MEKDALLESIMKFYSPPDFEFDFSKAEFVESVGEDGIDGTKEFIADNTQTLSGKIVAILTRVIDKRGLNGKGIDITIFEIIVDGFDHYYVIEDSFNILFGASFDAN